MTSAAFTLTAMTAAGCAFFIHHGLLVGWFAFDLPGNALWTMVGLIVFATVLLFMAEGVRRIGPHGVSCSVPWAPETAAGMAYLLYGERLSPLQLLGTLLVVVGVALLEWRSVRKPNLPACYSLNPSKCPYNSP